MNESKPPPPVSVGVVKPRGWTVLGTGPLADATRALIEKDPDRYLPETWSIDPAGYCPCCDNDVFRCTTRHTGWRPGFATHANVVHPSFNAKTHEPDPDGTIAGCCCAAPNWGPKHKEPTDERPMKPRRRKRSRR